MEPSTHELQSPAACFLVARLVGLDEALPQLDPGDAARLVQDHLELLAYQVLRHGGEVVDRVGTRLVAFFGTLGQLSGGAAPAESAVRSLRAALAMAEAIQVASTELGQRIDFSVGVCEVGGGTEAGVSSADGAVRDTAARAMAVAARLSHPLASGPVLATYGVLREVRGLFDVRALEPVPLGRLAAGVGRLPIYEVLSERRQGVRLAARKALGIETHLWGREIELGHMKAFLRRAHQDRRPYGLLLEGPVGVGKTRLAHELCRYATLLWPGSTILWTRCSQTGPANELLVEPLRVLVRKVKSQGPELATPLQSSTDQQERADFRDVMTELLADRRRQGRRLSDPQPPIPSDSEMAEIAEQSTLLAYLSGLWVEEEPAVRACSGDTAFLVERARRAAIAWLSAVARRGPVVFVIEALENADAGSLQLLERAFDQAEGPILIIGVATRGPESPGLRARLVPLPIDRLAPAACEELVAQLEAADRSGRVAGHRAQLLELAAGNPLLHEELCTVVADAVDGPLPTSLKELASLRVARLSPLERDLLLRAAVLGEVFDRESLLAMGMGHEGAAAGNPNADTLLAGLTGRGVLLSADELRPGAFRFRHAALPEAVLGLTTDSRRRELFGRAAAVLEGLGGNDELLARSYAGANQIDLAGTRGLRAIDTALGREAKDVAERILGWLLPLTSDRPLLRAELLERAAEVARRRGDWNAERAHLDEMAHQAQRTTQAFEPRLAARVALAEARARRRSGQFEAALLEAKKAIEAASQAEDRRLLLAALSLEGDLCRRLGQPDPSHASYARAQALAERLGDESGAVHARVRGTLARCFSEASDLTLSELEAAARAADDLGEEALFLEAQAALVDLLRDLGRFNRALSEGQRGLQRARRLGLPAATARMLVALSYSHLEQNEVRMALANCEQAVELAAQLEGEEAENHTQRVELCRVRLLLARGDAADLDGVERTCDYLVSRARTLSDYEMLAASLCSLAQAVHRRGGSSRARLLSSEALALVGKGVVPLDVAFQVRIGHAQVLEACGDVKGASDMREQIRAIIVNRLAQLSTPAGRAVYVNMAAARAALPPEALRPPE